MRPRNCRHIHHAPCARFFKPIDAPLRELETLFLKEEELEALLLADVKDMEQEEAARMMNVSRPTFSRILASARRTIASALTQGAAIRIEGGDNRFVSPHQNQLTKEDKMPFHDGTGPMSQQCGQGRGQGRGQGCGGKGRGMKGGRCGRSGMGMGMGRAQGMGAGQGRGFGSCGRGMQGEDEAKSLEILIAHEENRLNILREKLAKLQGKQA